MTVSPSTLASMCGMSAQMNSQVGLQMVAQQMAQQMAAQINAKVAEMAIQQIAQHTNTAMLQHMNPLVAPQQVAAPQQQPMVWIPADKYNALLQCATTNSVLQQINQPPISNAAPQIQLSQLQPQVAAQLRAAGTQSRPINWPISSFRTFEETEKFLNDSVTEFPEPSNVYTPYECGYCGEVKMTTASRSDDGRVRIRCKCGGKRMDGEVRMHAMWRLVKTDSSTPGTGSKNRYQAKTDSAKPDPRVQIKSA